VGKEPAFPTVNKTINGTNCSFAIAIFCFHCWVWNANYAFFRYGCKHMMTGGWGGDERRESGNGVGVIFFAGGVVFEKKGVILRAN